MWFADLFEDKIILTINKEKCEYNILNCCFVTIKNTLIYFLCEGKIFVYSNNKELYSFSVIDSFSNKLIVKDNIYVSGEDTGCISAYDLKGNIIKTVKMGEHLADFDIFNNFIFAITYNDNFLIKTNFYDYSKRIILQNIPQKIIIKNYVYILLNDENYSYIKMYNFNLDELKTISFQRQIGDIFLFDNRIIFNGLDFNYILSENLNILSQKRSTGEFLCKFSDIPIFEKTNKRFDLINNIIYPS